MTQTPLALTQADLAVLRAVQQDASRSTRDLASDLNSSPSTVWRRIDDLEAAGAIRGRVALLDPDLVGFPICMLVSVNMSNHDPATRSAFETFVLATPAIMQCFTVTGSHDYTLVVRCRSVPDFERLLMDEILAHPSTATVQSQLVLRQHKNSTALPL